MEAEKQAMAEIGDGPDEKALEAAIEAVADTGADDLAARPELDVNGEIAALATLTRVEYERRRKEAAKALGMRASVLDELVKERRKALGGDDGPAPVELLEPWPEPVEGTAIAEEMRERLRAHVIFDSPHDADLAALWAMGSYLMSVWALWPRLLITSPTKACGKTTLLQVLEALCHRSVMSANASPAALFRLIEAWSPTLLLDEADMWLRQSEDLASILNAGHTRRSASTLRAVEVGGDYEPRRFSTWAPIVIAGIGTQRDTLESRSIIITLRRRLPGERIERLPKDLFEHLEPLRRKTLRWAEDTAPMLEVMEIDPPENGDDRRRDNFEPLFRIAEVLSGPWPDRVRAGYFAKAEGEEVEEHAGVMLLRDLAALMEERGVDRITSADAVGHLVTLEERPWPEWNRGRPITARAVARLLRPFGVRPVNLRLSSGKVPKGYRLEDVTKALRPYDPPSYPLHRYSTENKREIDNSIRYMDQVCSGSETEISTENQSCSGVADRTGGYGENMEDEGGEWTLDL